MKRSQRFGDDLYLFTKNWVDYKTRCYQLPKQAGTHIAAYQSTFNINCLVTGAEVMQTSNSLMLIGYNTSGGSFTWTFENFTDDNFFNGNSTELIWTTLSQIEGVCMANDGNGIYISSEKFSSFLDPTLFYLDIPANTTTIENQNIEGFRIYSNNNLLIIQSGTDESVSAHIQLLNIAGTILYNKQFVNQQQVQIPLTVSKGIYLLVVATTEGATTYKIVL
ncbi:MAG: T9SS type A sorting domain-containing protein [Bacteroidales bacterium]